MRDLNLFIYRSILKRDKSLFDIDMKLNECLLLESIKDKSVLVIGGAGSIGASFIKALLPFKPAALIVVDINENALAELTRDLRSTKDLYMPELYITYPMDYSSPVFEKMFRSYNGFDIVGNFSAHKHVRSEKDIYSIEVLLQNNVLHAKKLLELLCKYPPRIYFCVSTDKAANPVNIMGASKRIMEDLIFSYSDIFPVKTARFANVAFSNGSLPASFLERIKKLQPISAPSDVKRYFVSPEESGQICLMAAVAGNNREIFFPKLERAQLMTFDTIARELLLSEGYEIIECESEAEAINMAEKLRFGSKQYPVYFSKSDTSGEKAYEEFYTADEIVDEHRFSSLGVITDKDKPNQEKLKRLFENLDMAFEKSNSNKEVIVRILRDYLVNFNHIETGKNLDDKL